jgi:O-antigen/teichoic acid export membrane protein
LAVAFAFRAILLVIPNFLQGIGDSRAGFWCTATGAIIFPPAFLIGCQWGVVGVAGAWLIGYPVMYAVNMVIASRRGRLDIRSLAFAPLQPVIAGCIMMAVVTTVRTILPGTLPEPLVLAILVTAGAVTYGGALFILFRSLAAEMVRMFYRSPAPT